MPENTLQSIGNRPPHSSVYGYGHMEDGFLRKTSAVVQPIQVQPVTHTPEKENQPLKPLGVSPVLPGTGSLTHNITRMLEDTTNQRAELRNKATRASHFSPYSMSHFMSFRHKIFQEIENNKSDDSIDVGNEDHEHLRTGDIPNATDSSISTQGSSSPHSIGTASSPSGSTNSSPGSSTDPVRSPVTSPENSEELPKKKARTNYTKEQVQALLTIFHENPYPDSEQIEDIEKKLGIPENKIKIWFQNKRARWRRRVNDVNNYAQFHPMSPMLSPVGPYGFIPTGRMMTSSPAQHYPGYFNYPWMQNSLSPNNNYQIPGQISSNLVHTRLQPTSHGVAMPNQHFPTVSMAQSVSSLSSASPYSLKTPSQQMMTPQYNRSQQFPLLYQTNDSASTLSENKSYSRQ